MTRIEGVHANRPAWRPSMTVVVGCLLLWGGILIGKNEGRYAASVEVMQAGVARRTPQIFFGSVPATHHHAVCLMTAGVDSKEVAQAHDEAREVGRRLDGSRLADCYILHQ